MRRYWEQFIPQSLSEFSWSLAHSPSSIVSLISFNIFFSCFLQLFVTWKLSYINFKWLIQIVSSLLKWRYELSFLMFFFSRSLNMKITVNLCGVWNWLIHSYTKKYANICDKSFFIISQTSIRKHQFSLEQSIILMPPFLGNFFLTT